MAHGVEELVADGLDHVEGAARRDRVHEDVAVDPHGVPAASTRPHPAPRPVSLIDT